MSNLQAAKKYRAAHLDERRAYDRSPAVQRAKWLRHIRRYGVTEVWYNEQLARQGGVCGICKQTPKGRFTRLCIDHDHKTGVVRGLLCIGCNATLGILERIGTEGIIAFLAWRNQTCAT